MIEFQELEEADLEKFVSIRKRPAPNAMVEKLLTGKPVFVLGENKENRLNGLYEIAKRRNMKCSLTKGELNGAVGYLVKFLTDAESETNGN